MEYEYNIYGRTKEYNNNIINCNNDDYIIAVFVCISIYFISR